LKKRKRIGYARSIVHKFKEKYQIMKKHIFGLAIFSFIVGAAAIVFAFFNVSEIVSVSFPQYALVETTHCKMEREVEELQIGSPLIKQATLNSKSGIFVFEIECVESPKRMSLYFYKKNAGNTPLIATGELDLKPSIKCKNKMSLSKSFNWAKEAHPASNIYVIAQTSDSSENFSVNFNKLLATPVLIDGNKLLIE
jgi:hypothetical protein